jgi:hypothetical protein
MAIADVAEYAHLSDADLEAVAARGRDWLRGNVSAAP